MEKTASAESRKRGKKQVKQQKKQALKVVYITNPIKFNATASEFRALVQELTGQDADVDSSRFAVQEEAKAAAVEDNAVAPESDEYCCSPVMIDNFQGLVASSLWHGDVDVHADDIFKTLGAI